MPINEVAWNQSLYWIKIHRIHLEGFMKENMLKIGAKIREVAEYESPIVNGVITRSFLHIRVWIYVNKTLGEGFWILRPGLIRKVLDSC